MANFRRETDLLGTRDVPADALWDIHTLRAIENFPVSGWRLPGRFIAAMGRIKGAAAVAHRQAGRLDARIADAIIQEGHRLAPQAAETVRGDSFVVQTNIHYPTDSSLIADGLRKVLGLAVSLAGLFGLIGWRQHKHLYRKARKLARTIASPPASASFAPIAAWRSRRWPKPPTSAAR
jgi:hypothetical protein